MTIVRFIVQEGVERVRLEFVFDEQVNEIVKGVVPRPRRGFDRRTRSWWVHREFAEHLAEHLLIAGHDVTGRLLPPLPASSAPVARPGPSIGEFFDQPGDP